MCFQAVAGNEKPVLAGRVCCFYFYLYFFLV
jgi:hypothetical protein